MILAFICHAYLADVCIQLGSLPSVVPAPHVAVSIEVITTSSSTDPDARPSIRVPPNFEASLMFSFKGAGSRTGNVLVQNPPLESTPITTVISQLQEDLQIPT